MTYFITFLEGIITFISPCLLPMLPIYLSYFAGGNPDESQGTVLKNAVGFVLGFADWPSHNSLPFCAVARIQWKFALPSEQIVSDILRDGVAVFYDLHDAISVKT